jgi:hypothetical protein
MIDFDLPVTPELNRAIRENLENFMMQYRTCLDSIPPFVNDATFPIPVYAWLKSWARDKSMKLIAANVLALVAEVQGVVWETSAQQLIADFATLDVFLSVVTIACNCEQDLIVDMRGEWVRERNTHLVSQLHIHKESLLFDIQHIVPHDATRINMVAILRYCLWFRKTYDFDHCQTTFDLWLPRTCLRHVSRVMARGWAHADTPLFWSAALFLMANMSVGDIKHLHATFRATVRQLWIDLPPQPLDSRQWTVMHALVRPTLHSYRNCTLLFQLAPSTPSTPACFDAFVRFILHFTNMLLRLPSCSLLSPCPTAMLDTVRTSIRNHVRNVQKSSWARQCTMLTTAKIVIKAAGSKPLTEKQWNALQPTLHMYPHLICLQQVCARLFGPVTKTIDGLFTLSFVGESVLAEKLLNGHMYFQSHARETIEPVPDYMLSPLQLLLNQLFLTPSKGRSWWSIMMDAHAIGNLISAHTLLHLSEFNNQPMSSTVWTCMENSEFIMYYLLSCHEQYPWFRRYFSRVSDVYIEHGLNALSRGPMFHLQASMQTWLIQNLRLPLEAPLLPYVTPLDFTLPCVLHVDGNPWSLSHTLMLATLIAEGPMMDRVLWVAKIVHLRSASMLCEQDFIILSTVAGMNDVKWRLGHPATNESVREDNLTLESYVDVDLRALEDETEEEKEEDEEKLWITRNMEDCSRDWSTPCSHSVPYRRDVIHGGMTEGEEKEEDVEEDAEDAKDEEDAEKDDEDEEEEDDEDEGEDVEEDAEDAKDEEDVEEDAEDAKDEEDVEEDAEDAEGAKDEEDDEDEGEDVEEDAEGAKDEEDEDEGAKDEEDEEEEEDDDESEEHAATAEERRILKKKEEEEGSGSETQEENKENGSRGGGVHERKGDEGQPEGTPTTVSPMMLLQTIKTLATQPPSALANISILDMTINLAFCRKPIFPPSFFNSSFRSALHVSNAWIAEQLSHSFLAFVIHRMQQSKLDQNRPFAFNSTPTYKGLSFVRISLPNVPKAIDSTQPTDIPDECPLCCEPVTDQEWLACDVCNEACCYTCAIRSATSHHDLGKLCPHAACGKHSCNNLPRAICLAILPIVRHMSGYLIREPSPQQIKVFEDMGGIYPFEKSPDTTFDTVTRNCPGCCAPIERAMGCLHMICRCGREFCWNCMGPAHTHYDCEGSTAGRLSRSAIMREFSNHLLELTTEPVGINLAFHYSLFDLHCRLRGVATKTAQNFYTQEPRHVRKAVYAMVGILPLMNDEQLQQLWLRGANHWCSFISQMSETMIW